MPLILGEGGRKKKSHAPQLSLYKIQSQMCHSTPEELNRLVEHTVYWQLFHSGTLLTLPLGFIFLYIFFLSKTSAKIST